MKLTNRQKSIIWKSLNLNEEFFDEQPDDFNMEDMIKDKRVKDCNYDFTVYPLPYPKVFNPDYNITKLLVNLNNHTSINQKGENIFDGLVLWEYDSSLGAFKFGFDEIKDDKLMSTMDTFRNILDYLIDEFGTYDVVIGRPKEHVIIETKTISPKDPKATESLLRYLLHGVALDNIHKQTIFYEMEKSLNEDFFDENPYLDTEDIMEEKQLKDCNFSFGIYPLNTNIDTNITKLLVDLNNHTSINQKGENIFDGLVLWKYDPNLISFKFGFDRIKEDKLEDITDTFEYIIYYLLSQFGTSEVVWGKPNKNIIITTKKISLNDKDVSSINSLIRRITFDILLKN